MSSSQAQLLQALQQIAPLEFAESWDNVGLLLDRTHPAPVERCLLTIDLTTQVLDEALERGCDSIIAYHPPIFDGLKRLRMDSPKESIILRAAAANLLIYSPHTALDAAADGVTDWLAGIIGSGSSEAIHPREGTDGTPDRSVGMGRRLELDAPQPLTAIVERIKTGLHQVHVRVADSGRTEIRSAAVCPGAGGSVVAGCETDLILTGEMRHHDVLAALDRGTTVVLCDHTNTERGYLPTLADRLTTALPTAEFNVASVDRDPLEIV